ncbi:hypothetical protein CEK71_17495 [Methylovulum psychrotolerans]|uniref:Uncharacterized protein n=2 Tax=Methylovulum psychrotolerans TaxID=1704499 RepID=A0A1Z4C2F2_9GAMM|nr:hypothetical protein CEK71_17495 [Methylovulum psychrotolerans]
MCYMTLLSTTAEDDLAVNNNGLVRFSSELPGIPEEKYLSFKNQWYIGSQHGCSCGFRHLYTSSVELGFGEPQEWYSEEASDIEATLQVIAIIRKLVERGELVDCVDAWAHGQETAEPLEGDLEINLAKINDPSFRFFENRRFLFLNQA